MPEGSSCAHARSNRNQSFKNVNPTDEAPRAERQNTRECIEGERERQERERKRDRKKRERERQARSVRTEENDGAQEGREGEPRETVGRAAR
jgi:hypothetical protein